VGDSLTLFFYQLNTTLVRMFNHPHPMVSSTASRTAGKDVKLRGGVLAAVQSHTHFLDSPRIRESLAKSDFTFEDLKSKRLTVYLILPADRLSTFNRWLRLLIQQAITVNARNIAEKPAKPILFLLDEMPTLGKLPSVQQAYGLMAGFGMQLWGIVQDLSQLAQIYGEHGWQTFVSNSGVIQYFGSRDKMTADYFSALCGVTTIEVHNLSWAFGKAISYATSFSSSSGKDGGSTSFGSSTTDSSSWTRTHGSSEAQRHLAYADELMVLKGNQQIVFVENLDPIMAEKVLWYKDLNLKAHGVDLQAAPPPNPPIQPSPAPQTVLTLQLMTPTPAPQPIEREPAPSPEPAEAVASQPALAPQQAARPQPVYTPPPAPTFEDTLVQIPITHSFSGAVAPGYVQPKPVKPNDTKSRIAKTADGKTIFFQGSSFVLPRQEEN
jgi:type IV secretion system protein VirD4